MCEKQISSRKFFKLFFEVEFYSIVIYFVFVVSGYASFSFSSLLKALIPITNIQTNFTACFLVFYLCIPFINILIHSLNEKMHLLLVLLCSFIYIFFGTARQAVSMNYVSWFMVIYFISSYIRLYPKRVYDKKYLWGFVTLISIILLSASVVVCAWFGRNPYMFAIDSNTLLAVIIAISSFLFFKNINIKYSKFINAVSASTFGVLLIHANSNTMRQWLWRDTLKNTEAFLSDFWFAHAIISVLLVFIICIVADMLRIRFIEKPFFVLWDNIWLRISCAFKTLKNKFLVIYKRL